MTKVVFKTIFLTLFLAAVAVYSFRIFKTAEATPKFAFVLFYVLVAFGLTVYKYISDLSSRQTIR